MKKIRVEVHLTPEENSKLVQMSMLNARTRKSFIEYLINLAISGLIPVRSPITLTKTEK